MSSYAERPERSDGSLVPPSESGASSRVRRSRNELREIVLSAGREVLLTDGLGTGVEHLSFKRVFDHVEETQGFRVTNASVIGRIWQNQEDFQADVVRSVVDAQGDSEVDGTAGALARALDRIDLSTIEMRRASLSELIRVSCEEFLRAASSSAAAIQSALVAYIAARHHTGGDDRILTSYQLTDDRLSIRYRSLYSAALDAVGFRIKPHLTLDEAVAILTSLAEGMVMRRLVEPEMFGTIVQVRALDGCEVQWSLLAVGMDAVADFFVEPDPDWHL